MPDLSSSVTMRTRATASVLVVAVVLAIVGLWASLPAGPNPASASTDRGDSAPAGQVLGARATNRAVARKAAQNRVKRQARLRSAAVERCRGANETPTARNRSRMIAAVECLIDAERTSRGIKALRRDRDLARSADDFAGAMVRQGFFGHKTPQGRTFPQRMRSTKYVRNARTFVTGENLAWGSGPLATPRSAVQRWMASSSHRANILDRRYADSGIGLELGSPGPRVRGLNVATWVQHFGSRRTR